MDSRKTFVFHRPWSWRYLLKPRHHCRIFINGVLVNDLKNGETVTFTLPPVPLYLIGIAEDAEHSLPCTHLCVRSLSDDAPIHVTVRCNPEITWHTAWECTCDHREASPLIDRINQCYVLPEDSQDSVSDAERTILLCNEFLLDAVDGIDEVLKNSRFSEMLTALDTVGDTEFSEFLRFFLKEKDEISAFPIPALYIDYILTGFSESAAQEWYTNLFPNLRTLYRQIIEYLIAHM